jgi:hypothetical protein
MDMKIIRWFFTKIAVGGVHFYIIRTLSTKKMS